MKMNIQKGVLLFISMLFTITLSAQGNQQDASKYVGNWTVSIPDAPYGYQSGTVTLKVTDGKLNGEFKVDNSTMKVDSFKETNEGYSCTVYVDGYPVNISLKLKDGIPSGVADAEGMIMPITFKKAG